MIESQAGSDVCLPNIVPTTYLDDVAKEITVTTVKNYCLHQ